MGGADRPVVIVLVERVPAGIRVKDATGRSVYAEPGATSDGVASPRAGIRRWPDRFDRSTT